MVALKTERRAYLWRVSPSASPSHVDRKVTLQEIIDILTTEVSANRARVHVSEGRILDPADPDKDDKNQIFIADIKSDD
jgi:hypothetical protein